MIKTPSKPKNYTIVCNEVAQREDLSARAKGIYYYLATLPHDWELNQKELFSHFTEGECALRKAFTELVDAGYIKSTPKRNEKGQLDGKNYVVFWTVEPSRSGESPSSVNPAVDKPAVDNQQLQSTNSNKVKKYITNYQDISERYRDAFIREHPSLQREIEKFYNVDAWCDTIDKLIRIDGYTREEVLEVLKFVIKDDFWHRQMLSLSSLRKKGNNGLSKFVNAKMKMEQSSPQPKITNMKEY